MGPGGQGEVDRDSIGDHPHGKQTDTDSWKRDTTVGEGVRVHTKLFPTPGLTFLMKDIFLRLRYHFISTHVYND